MVLALLSPLGIMLASGANIPKNIGKQKSQSLSPCSIGLTNDIKRTHQ